MTRVLAVFAAGAAFIFIACTLMAPISPELEAAANRIIEKWKAERK